MNISGLSLKEWFGAFIRMACVACGITRNDDTDIMLMNSLGIIPQQVIQNTMIPITIGGSAGQINVEMRRTRVGNIYLYRMSITNTLGADVSFPPGSRIIGTADIFTELPEYVYSNQMGAIGYKITSQGYAGIQAELSGHIGPDGIILRTTSTFVINANTSLAFEATRCPLGAWGVSQQG